MDIDILPRTTRSNSADVSMTAAGTAESNPYVNGLPGEMQQKLAKRCAELFEVYVDHHASMGRVTLWGVTDDGSWLNNFPTRGRTNYPLPFDRQGKPKPAFAAVLEAAQTLPKGSRGEGQPAGQLRKQPSNLPYQNPELPPERRAADLVSRMTLEEKVLQMQNSAPAIPRLGVPVYNWWNKALHGAASGRAAVFPETIGLGAMWECRPRPLCRGRDFYHLRHNVRRLRRRSSRGHITNHSLLAATTRAAIVRQHVLYRWKSDDVIANNITTFV